MFLSWNGLLNSSLLPQFASTYLPIYLSMLFLALTLDPVRFRFLFKLAWVQSIQIGWLHHWETKSNALLQIASFTYPLRISCVRASILGCQLIHVLFFLSPFTMLFGLYSKRCCLSAATSVSSCEYLALFLILSQEYYRLIKRLNWMNNGGWRYQKASGGRKRRRRRLIKQTNRCSPKWALPPPMIHLRHWFHLSGDHFPLVYVFLTFVFSVSLVLSF